MPLFSHREPEPAPAPVVEEPHSRRTGLFGSRHRDTSPTNSYSTANTGRHSVETQRTSLSNTSTGGGLMSKLRGGRDVEMDPSIVNARNRVMKAEEAETEADKYLEQARREVVAARQEVKRLEQEAAEEARLAKIKQHHANEVSKRGSRLGRHGG